VHVARQVASRRDCRRLAKPAAISILQIVPMPSLQKESSSTSNRWKASLSYAEQQIINSLPESPLCRCASVH